LKTQTQAQTQAQNNVVSGTAEADSPTKAGTHNPRAHGRLVIMPQVFKLSMDSRLRGNDVVEVPSC
jgi:hypothetical protein